MAHSSLQPLLVLLEQAERDRDDAQAVQRRCEAALSNAVAQQSQLSEYRQEYESRWGAQFRQGVTMTLLQVYQDFRERLLGAADLQARQVARLQQQLDDARAAVLAAELRVAAVRKLLQRRQAAILLRAERQDQKQQDEFAARVTWQRRAAAAMMDMDFGAER